MKKQSTLSFKEIQQVAGCAWKLEKLGRQLAIHHPCDPSGPYGDNEPQDYSRQAKTVRAIEIVMGIIGKTPNACINREALDALQDEVEFGLLMTKGNWIAEILDIPEEGDIPW
jgi:hypothetical protein